jgi:hypothetical protein
MNGGKVVLCCRKSVFPAEVMLCSQMIATWEVGMQMLTASKQATDFQSLTEQGALAVKLLSVFERQFATLTKARKPPQQTVIVQHEHIHKHLHVEAPGETGCLKLLKAKPTNPPIPEPSHLRRAPRCLARTRRGTLCRSPATKHGRCRMHNGSWKHGRYSRESIEARRAMRALLREARAMLSKVTGMSSHVCSDQRARA